MGGVCTCSLDFVEDWYIRACALPYNNINAGVLDVIHKKISAAPYSCLPFLYSIAQRP